MDTDTIHQSYSIPQFYLYSFASVCICIYGSKPFYHRYRSMYTYINLFNITLVSLYSFISDFLSIIKFPSYKTFFPYIFNGYMVFNV